MLLSNKNEMESKFNLSYRMILTIMNTEVNQ